LLLALVALTGAAVAVIPALAASSEAMLELNKNCVKSDWPCWTSAAGANPPPTYTTTIAAGGSVTFVDHSQVAANIVWKTSTAPACAPSVPVSPTPAASEWEGKCTFEKPGTYEFESPGLFYPSGYKIVVEGAGTGTTTTSTTNSTSSSPGASNPSLGSGTQTQPGVTAGPGQAGSVFVGSASSAYKLPSVQHGQSVHGSLDLSQAGAGGRLEVELLATGASLAGAGRSPHVEVGRLVRSSLAAGTVKFAVSLDAKAKRALHARGHLTLAVKLLLTPAQGMATTVTRSVILRP
jgi:hypothetical protein